MNVEANHDMPPTKELDYLRHIHDAGKRQSMVRWPKRKNILYILYVFPR